jgi:hypothetical protein
MLRFIDVGSSYFQFITLCCAVLYCKLLSHARFIGVCERNVMI